MRTRFTTSLMTIGQQVWAYAPSSLKEFERLLPAPSADFDDPSWGVLDGDSWSIELNMGDEEECECSVFHVRGGDTAAGVVAAILAHFKLRALDSSKGEFFAAGEAALESFRKWREYRDKALGC
jgi:hypothetical protein